MAEKPACSDEAIDSKEIHEEMCKKSMATENCVELKEKAAQCFPESSNPEAKEDIQFGKIEERRRSFIIKTKDDLSKVGTETFTKFVTKPKTAEEMVNIDHPKGPTSEGDDFITPFTVSNPAASGGGLNSKEGACAKDQ